MKRIINKNTILGIFIGIIICGVGVYATNYAANTIDYTTNKNSNVKTVKDALDDLYNKKDENTPELVWTNPNPTSNFSEQTISLDLSDYKYAVVVMKTSTIYDFVPRSTSIIPLENDYPEYSTSVSIYGGTCERSVRANVNGIYISNEFKCNDNSGVIPYKIYGIKNDLNLDIMNN